MWQIWQRSGASLAELQTRWTVGDLVTAAWQLEAQDLIDEASMEANRP